MDVQNNIFFEYNLFCKMINVFTVTFLSINFYKKLKSVNSRVFFFVITTALLLLWYNAYCIMQIEIEYLYNLMFHYTTAQCATFQKMTKKQI